MAGIRGRVCMTTQEYPPMFWGGLARAVRRVAGFVSEMGWEVHVANLYEDQAPPELLDEIVASQSEDGLMVHRIRIGRETGLPNNTLWDSPDTLSVRLMHESLERLHRRYRFDVFHVFFLYPIGHVAALLANAYRKKLILSIRGNDINQFIFSPEKSTFLQTALRRADVVTSVAQGLLAKAETLTPVLNKSRVIFNSITLRDGPSDPVDLPPLDGRVIGTVGLFKSSKGLPHLLKAFRKIREEWQSSLLLVGGFREAEREIQSRYLSRFGSDRVYLTGPVPHEAIDFYLKQMDVFVLPSLSEGCPHVLLEAMAAGCPIVATRTGAIPEIIRDGETGILVDPGDSFQIEEAVRHLFRHPEEAKAMGRRAHEKVDEFSEEGEREGWREVYRLIGGGLDSAVRFS